MTIKEVCETLDITADTLRYYEKIGIIPKIPRNKNGIREFDKNSIDWIKFIKCMRKAGLSIEVLIEYVNLFQQGSDTSAARKNILIEQKKELEKKMKELKETIELLEYKIKNYDNLIIEAEKKLK